MLNKVVLMGRLVKDPELKYTPSNVAVVSFTVAVDRKYQKQDEKQAGFINIVAWRSTAEFVSKWFRKGQMIALCGSIQTRVWDDNDGNRRYVTEVVAEEVSFAGSKSDSQAPVQEENVESDFIDVTPAVRENELPF
jgi:single-strand DNA-binding protein